MPDLRITMLAFALALCPLSVQAQERVRTDARERTLTMTGSARLAMRADTVRARGAILVEDDSAARALAGAKRRMAALRGAMEPFGAVEASAITLGQNRPRSARLIRSDDPGFTARGEITVALADPGRAGEALDALAGAGIDGVAYLEYDVADRTALLEDVRRRAVADARERARIYAEAADLTLGPVVDLSEAGIHVGGMGNGDRYGPHASYGAKGAMGPQDPAVAATVTIRWALE